MMACEVICEIICDYLWLRVGPSKRGFKAHGLHAMHVANPSFIPSTYFMGTWSSSGVVLEASGP